MAKLARESRRHNQAIVESKTAPGNRKVDYQESIMVNFGTAWGRDMLSGA